MKFFAQTEAELNAAQSDGETDVLVSIEAMREWIDITRQLSEQRAELLWALQEMVEFFQPNACGSEDNKRDALNGAFRILNKIEAKP